MSKIKHPHPMQPVIMADDEVIRFKKNPIVRYMLAKGGIDLNHIAIVSSEQGFKEEDHAQLAQLIGCSVSGYGKLPYVSLDSMKKADDLAHKIIKKRKRKSP